MIWIWFILIGLAAGFLAGAVVKGSGFGLLGNLIIGVIGAVWADSSLDCWASRLPVCWVP